MSAVDLPSLRAVRLKLVQLEREIRELDDSTAFAEARDRARIVHHASNLRHTASKLRILLNDAVGADAWSKSHP